MGPWHLKACYLKVVILPSMWKIKVDNWIQQIYPQSVSSHNEKIADRASPGVW